jgi:hypothetical protein
VRWIASPVKAPAVVLSLAHPPAHHPDAVKMLFLLA